MSKCVKLRDTHFFLRPKNDLSTSEAIYRQKAVFIVFLDFDPQKTDFWPYFATGFEKKGSDLCQNA